MTMKKGARSIRKGIFEHKKRTSGIYAELAHAPEDYREHVLSTFQNPLVRKYARARVEEEVTNLALARMANEELDPTPFEHQHEGCPIYGYRFPEPDSDHDIFSPREGYVTNREAYGA